MQLNPKRARHGQFLTDVEVQMKLVESVACREVGSDVTEGVIQSMGLQSASRFAASRAILALTYLYF